MKTKITLTLALLCIPLVMMGQENIFGGPALLSPEVGADGRVTFRLQANAGSHVQVAGDFLPVTKIETPFGLMDGQAPADMTLEDGVWTFTTSEALAPELYSYYFTVDGTRVLDPSNVCTVRDGSSYTNTFAIRKADGDRGDLYTTGTVPHGTVSRVWYPSPTLGNTRRLTVYTPAGYEESDSTYPVLYLLHGAGGDEDAWTTLGCAAQIMDHLIAGGQAKPMIVVMPNGNAGDTAAADLSADLSADTSADTSVHGADSPDLDQSVARMVESFPDLMAFVEGRYRVEPGKAGRAIAGLSMGGGLAFDISRTYPDRFDYVGLLSPAIFLGGHRPEDLQGERRGETDEVMASLRTQFGQAPRLYWMAIGTGDFLYQADMRFLDMMRSHAYPVEYMETDGGHTWRNWRHYLTVLAPMLF